MAGDAVTRAPRPSRRERRRRRAGPPTPTPRRPRARRTSRQRREWPGGRCRRRVPPSSTNLKPPRRRRQLAYAGGAAASEDGPATTLRSRRRRSRSCRTSTAPDAAQGTHALVVRRSDAALAHLGGGTVDHEERPLLASARAGWPACGRCASPKMYLDRPAVAPGPIQLGASAGHGHVSSSSRTSVSGLRRRRRPSAPAPTARAIRAEERHSSRRLLGAPAARPWAAAARCGALQPPTAAARVAVAGKNYEEETAATSVKVIVECRSDWATTLHPVPVVRHRTIPVHNSLPSTSMRSLRRAADRRLRRLRGARPSLLPALKDANAQVVEAAIGAILVHRLVAIPGGGRGRGARRRGGAQGDRGARPPQREDADLDEPPPPRVRRVPAALRVRRASTLRTLDHARLPGGQGDAGRTAIHPPAKWGGGDRRAAVDDSNGTANNTDGLRYPGLSRRVRAAASSSGKFLAE